MRKIAGVSCLEKVDHHLPGNGLLILFHGYGADAHDLQSLAEVLRPPESIDFLFPQGPLSVPIGPGWMGRAWWKINVDALVQMAKTTSQDNGYKGDEKSEFSSEVSKGLREVRPHLQKMIQETKIPWHKIILGGFSQGAMLATDLFLQAPESPRGLLIFSGMPICQDEWRNLLVKRQGKLFFQSHGRQDEVLSFKDAQRLETLLTQGGMKGTLQSFVGGHEIPLPILEKANQYLQQI